MVASFHVAHPGQAVKLAHKPPALPEVATKLEVLGFVAGDVF